MTSSIDQRKAKEHVFLDACRMTAQADGRVDQSEVAAVVKGLREIGYLFEDDEINDTLSDETDAGDLDLHLLESQEEREALISVMLLVAQSDGEYSSEEQDLISEVQETLGITDNRMIEIIDLIDEARTVLADRAK